MKLNQIFAVPLATLLLFSIYSVSTAQDAVTGSFEGVVRDKATDNPITGALVEFTSEVTGVSVSARTDSAGRFYMGLLSPGYYRIQISMAGYITVERKYALHVSGSILPIFTQLEPIESKNQTQNKTTGSLAVAALPNAIITVEALDGSPPYKNTIPKDERLSVFDNLQPKSYRVSADLEGYQPAKRQIQILPNKTLPLTLDLLPSESSTRILNQAGKYYALIIGNNNYQHISHLKTAEADARAIESVLREKYGFETKLLLNANREQIIVALNEYRHQLVPSANLLIYYAGHGHNDEEVEKAYWLPVDARTEDNANWISADDITINIKGIPARHILIISDSCYSGTIVRGLETITSEPVGRDRYLVKMSSGKSRTLMASGGNEPVADGGGVGHSVFAGALLTGLGRMDRQIFSAEELYYTFIREVVTGKSNQTPEYNPIRNSGHESGDFVFILKK